MLTPTVRKGASFLLYPVLLGGALLLWSSLWLGVGWDADMSMQLVYWLFLAVLVVLIVLGMIAGLAFDSQLSIRQFGVGFLTSRNWDPVKGEFGALPFIYGTVASSVIAIMISVPLSLGIAIFLVEQAPHYLSRPITFVVELLAAIPSVVYGLWGIFVLAPFLRVYVEPRLARWLGWSG